MTLLVNSINPTWINALTNGTDPIVFWCGKHMSAATQEKVTGGTVEIYCHGVHEFNAELKEVYEDDVDATYNKYGNSMLGLSPGSTIIDFNKVLTPAALRNNFVVNFELINIRPVNHPKTEKFNQSPWKLR